tara:strand:+ start:74 stop:586 length:513 start_codon:yes stop_codon:yes gene_type:complete
MFKVGDKVREIHRNVGESRYFYTNGKSVSEIVKINDDRLNIKILHAWSLDQVGTKVWVDASRMELIEEKVEPKVSDKSSEKATIKKEVEVYITDRAAKDGVGCGEYFFKEERGYEGRLIKAKLTFEVPNRKIEITEQDLRRALKIADTKLAKGDGDFDENVYQELFKESK